MNIALPIIQGPFGGGASSVDLVVAVSEAGGLGSYGANHLSSLQIKEVAKEIRMRTDISAFLVHEQMWIRFIGGLFLLYLGTKTFVSKPVKKAAAISQGKNAIRAYFSTFFLTATNPMTILSFVAVFAGLGLGSVYVSYWTSFLLVLGVILGSLIWWVLLTFTVAKLFHHRINALWLKWINRISGGVLIIFGTAACFSIFIT